ncbi:MAG: Nramp family divalent metal transporter, partial [Planctomycetes bacterium]|nr:Nramp family divalent metal transporter [Planctomycetota bacterium]
MAVEMSTVAAGRLAPWQLGELPEPPQFGAQQWLALLGPGIVMAGAAVGAGEWLFGPAVTAQYGTTFLWLATVSIVLQVVVNLEVMRYTLYCGEPVMIGYFRTWPGPRVWTVWYLILDFPAFWPLMAANAAVPLAAAFLGHLPGEGGLSFGGIVLSEVALVRILGYAVFLLGIVPLIFGGTIYQMLERVMVMKIVLVFGFLCLLAVFTVSAGTAVEVFTGFIRFGSAPVRAETIIAGPHFAWTERDGPDRYTIRGSMENAELRVTEFMVNRGGAVEVYRPNDPVPHGLKAIRSALVARVRPMIAEGRFFVEDTRSGMVLRIQGRITPEQTWEPERIVLSDSRGVRRYRRLDEVPEPIAELAASFIADQGVERVNVLGYLGQHGQLPQLNWAMLAAFAGIAGAGGLSNTLFSNYARDKGWGMGKTVGAIPSALGGRTILLSHVGKVFRAGDGAGDGAGDRWRRWMRHIVRDQVVWLAACILGVALPCLLSLQFIRHVPVEGHRVAALTADAIARRHPEYQALLWYSMLACGFLVLAPGQIFGGDAIARKWTDVIWNTSTRARH